MTRLLATTRSRLIALLAAALFALAVVSGGVIRAYTVDAGAEQVARFVAVGVRGADAALAGRRAGWPEYAADGYRHADAPPPGPGPRTRFAVAVGRELADRYGAANVRLLGGAAPEIWIRPRADGPWIGVAVLPIAADVLAAAFWIIVVTAVAVLAIATLAARGITRPLERLARNADALLHGRLPAAALAGAPREVELLADALGRAARERAAELARRETLLAETSHDLRTPLARLKFALELGDAATPAGRDAMTADLDDMDALIAQYLALVREGRDEDVVPVALAELARDVVEAAARGGVSIALHAAALPPITARPLALKRALANLVDNAARHGRPPIHVVLAADGDAQVVTVRDAGPSAGGGAPRGFGLGLSIVRAVAARHGGDLGTTTAADGGFEVRLRLRGA